MPSPTATANVAIRADGDISLPPQTTPFSYLPLSGDPCRQSVYCPYVTQLEYSAGAAQRQNPMRGQACFAVQTTYYSGWPSLGLNPECYPPNYFDLFPMLRQEELQPHLIGSGVEDYSMLAYPGTACPSAWTPGCTTTVHDDGQQGGGGTPFVSQVWCCPPGGWECASTTWAGARPERLCRSVLTQATEVWMTWDPPASVVMDSGPGKETYTCPYPVTAEAWENAARVFHKAFPLSYTPGLGPRQDATAPTEAAATGQHDAVTSLVHGHAQPSPDRTLSRDGIIGFACGGFVILLGFLIGILAVIKVKRREKRRCKVYLSGGKTTEVDSGSDVEGERSSGRGKGSQL